MEQEDIGIDVECGNVVIEVTPKPTRDGSFEWTYKFRRSYEYGGEEKRAWFFRREHDEAVGKAMVRAFYFMDQNDPTEWAKKHLPEAA